MTNYNIPISVISNADGALCKEISLVDGQIQKAPIANMWRGLSQKINLKSLNEISELIDSLSHNEALALGVTGEDIFEIKAGHTGRTIENFKLIDGKQFFFLDIDDSEYPLDETLDKLYKAIPEFKDVSYFQKVSSSGGIADYEKDNWHLWFIAECGLDIPKLKNIIQFRLHEAGYSCCKISSNGGIHLRNRLGIDVMVFSPERLIFEAKPILNDGLEMNAALNQLHIGSKDILAISDITCNDVSSSIQAFKNSKKTEAKRKIEANPDLQHLRKSEKQAMIDGVIAKDFLLYFDNGTVIKAVDADAVFDNLTLQDPHDDKKRAGKAKFFWNNGNTPVIYSIRTETSYPIQGKDIRKGRKVKSDKKIVRIPVKKARTQLAKFIHEFLAYDGYIFNVLRGECGLGKTDAILDVLLDIEFNDTIHYVVKNHDLAIEFLTKLHEKIDNLTCNELGWMPQERLKMKKWRLKQRVIHISGRNQPKQCMNPLKDSNLFKNIGSKICENCFDASACSYREQFNRRGTCKIWVHQHLTSAMPFLQDKHEFDDSIVFIDESCFDNLVFNKIIKFEDASDGICKIIKSENINQEAIIDEYKRLKKIDKQTREATDNFNKLTVLDSNERKHLMFYEEIIQGNFSKFEVKDNSLIFTDISKIGEHFINAEKLMIFDATAHRDYYNIVLDRHYHMLDLKVNYQKNIKLTQYLDKKFSKINIIDNHTEMSLYFKDKINALHKEGKRVGLITYGKLLDDQRKEFMPELLLADVTGYFYNVRGSNAFENVDVLFIIGRPSLGSDSLENKAKALGIYDYSTYSDTELIETNIKGEFYEVAVTRYVDENMNALYHQLCTAELDQCIARVRTLYGNKHKEILLFTNEYHNCPVTDVVVNEFCSNPITNKLIDYIVDNKFLSTKPKNMALALDEEVTTINDYKKQCKDYKIFNIVTVNIKDRKYNKRTLEFMVDDNYNIVDSDLPNGYVLS